MKRCLPVQEHTAKTDEKIRQSLHKLYDIQPQDWIWMHLRQRLLSAAEQANLSSQTSSKPEKCPPN